MIRRLVRAATSDLEREGRAAHAHVRASLSRARGAVVATGLFLVGTEPTMRRFVAYSLETGEVLHRG